ncbi:MAG: outer membrane protein transport protein [Prosthecochloris sp.]|nr:outer membrane protein transport protein [Prosthecochloris sp.]
MSVNRTHLAVVMAALFLGTPPAYATNGMNLEGYGAKAHAMGGASMAYDTGNSAVMNNPATLALMAEGMQRIGVGMRGLHPHVSAEFGGIESKSGGDSYYMPSLSYMRRDGKISWGVAMLAQGGMGTEYGSGSPLFSMGLPFSAYPGGAYSPDDYVPMSGKEIRSEVGMGRVMFPAAYHIDDRTSFGWSLDIVWASMDVLMDVDGYTFGSFLDGIGGSVSGSMLGMFASGGNIDYARFEFSNESEFTGIADGYGWGVKAGITHRFSDRVRVGASYHSQTHISDLETSGASISFAGSGEVKTLKGTVKVKDFEWPETIAFGIAVAPSERWLLAADIKLLNWSAVMDDFSMEFTASDDVSVNGPAAGTGIVVSMEQKWDDQVVFAAGAQYTATEALKLRAGANFGSNPVPDTCLNPLFPAIVTTHYTGGFGYDFPGGHAISGALAYVPEVTETNAAGITIEHSQLNWSMSYGYTF